MKPSDLERARTPDSSRRPKRGMARRSSARAARRANQGSSLVAARRALTSSSFFDGAQQYTPSAHAALAALGCVPDLLHTEAQLALDGPLLCGALDFAFAGGGCLETLERALDESPLAPSDWDPDSFADDLFLSDFVELCMQVRLKAWTPVMNRRYLTRLLAAPPSDREVVRYRRSILRELVEDAELRASFESLYYKLCLLRLQFALQEITSKYEETRHRVETLTLLRDVLEEAWEAFSEAGSGLRRIHEFGQEARDSEGFADLSELLAYENELAHVDVQVQLGADGRLRRFNLLAVRENQKNRFHVSPVRRFLGRMALFFRGYRFSSDELVERWLDTVFDGVKHLIPPLIQLLGHMELYLGSLAFRDRCLEKGLPVCFPELVDPPPLGGAAESRSPEDGEAESSPPEGEGVSRAPRGRRVRGLFNPVLFAQDIKPVPCDIDSDTVDTIHIVTGPNSGGKTRLLQTVGLTQLLAQGGLFVPAAEARLHRASGLYVSLVGLSDPRPELGEGRLGTELIRIRQMFETSRPGALVILDEFCSGTNPSEGEEIFYLVLSLLKELGAEVFISTHFLEFTRRLSREDDRLSLAFLQVGIDEDLRPTYTVETGVAETSLAAQTAARLGVTREELLSLVRKNRR